MTSKITFAVLKSSHTWKYDLTKRFMEHYAYQAYGQSYEDYIIEVDSVDQALNRCKTEYLVVQTAGHVIFDSDFFSTVLGAMQSSENLVLGHVVLQDDYVVLDRRCIVFDMKLWRSLGSISFDDGRIKDGPKYAVSVPSDIEYLPKEVVVVTGASREFVPSICSQNGASIVIKQLDEFGKIMSLSGLLSTYDAHYLDDSTALSEIVSETFYEKRFLPLVKDQIFAVDTDALGGLVDQQADIVCAPAIGLKPLNLLEHYGAKRVIVYSSNDLALELQRRILTVTSPTTFGEVMSEFLSDYPHANIIDDWSEQRFSVITPCKAFVEYKKIDLFSFEVIDMVSRIDHEKSLVIDFSNLLTNPYEFYRRPLYQVQGLFAELYSILKSRTGATFILGQTPGYKELTYVEVNTSVAKYTIDPTIDPMKPDADGFEKPPLPPLVFAPEFPEIVKEEVVEKPALLKKFTEPKVSVKKDILAIAEDLGYIKSLTTTIIGADEKEVTLLSKSELLDGIEFVFDYFVDVANEQWSFKVGIVGQDKRVEFSNGISNDTFKKHLLNDFKINPTTTRKFFGV